MFMERSLSLVARGGACGILSLNSWMMTVTFKKFRSLILSATQILNVVHLGRGIAGVALDFATTVYIVGSCSFDYYIRFMRVGERAQSTSDSIRTACLRRLVRRDETGDDCYLLSRSRIREMPNCAFLGDLSDRLIEAFRHPLGEIAEARVGLQTGDNERFLRQWFEVSADRSYMRARDREDAKASGARWFPHIKGGSYRKWWGNQSVLIAFSEGDQRELSNLGNHLPSRDFYFKQCVSWSNVSSGEPSFRLYDASFIFSHVGQALFPSDDKMMEIIAFGNSRVAGGILETIAPGTHFEAGQVKNLPWIEPDSFDPASVERLIDIFRADWESRETSWDFARPPYLRGGHSLLQDAFDDWYRRSSETAEEAQRLETENNRYWVDVYGLGDEVDIDVPLSRVSLIYNPRFAFAPTKGAPERSEDEYRWLHYQRSARELISWAIGVTMGRYSVDVPGLVLADQASTLDDFRARVAEPRLQTDDDGIIPVTGGAFDDDASRRVKAVLRVVFGASDLGDNIEFLTRCLAVKPGSNTAEFVPPVIPADPEQALEDYMAKSFAADHQKDYSGCPVYWSLESPKGTFRALIYLHRYTPDTVGQVLTKYAAPFVDQLKAESEAVGRERDAVMGDDRKADRERARIDKKRSEIDAKVAEVQGYIDSVLQPLAQRRIHLDLDDGVRINRLKLAYGWRSDLADLPQPAIGVATAAIKKEIEKDLKWARKEAEKNNVWWSE